MKKVLLTGSQGFIGSYICNELLSNNYKVFGIDNFSKYGDVTRSHDTHDNFTFYNLNILSDNFQTVCKDINPDIILGNTYHLYLRPQTDILEKAGGLHKFMNWDRNILTDSGGYQVYSLSSNRKIKEEGVKFKSHIDGSYHFFSPENVMEIQRTIGADIIMAFDECTPYPCDYRYAKRSMHMTHRWLDRCITHLDKLPFKYGYEQTFFPIVQGSTYKDLREQSAEYIANAGAQGNAIGGLSVGEPAEEMYAMTEVVTAILPEDKKSKPVDHIALNQDLEIRVRHIPIDDVLTRIYGKKRKEDKDWIKDLLLSKFPLLV